MTRLGMPDNYKAGSESGPAAENSVHCSEPCTNAVFRLKASQSSENTASQSGIFRFSAPVRGFGEAPEAAGVPS
jgi:hypothetical protein